MAKIAVGEYVDVVRTKRWQEWLNSSVRYGQLRPECSCRTCARMLKLNLRIAKQPEHVCRF